MFVDAADVDDVDVAVADVDTNYIDYCVVEADVAMMMLKPMMLMLMM